MALVTHEESLPFKENENFVPPAGDEQRAARVLRQFRMIFSAVRLHFQAIEKQTGIGGAQFWALSLIAERPGVSINALASAMDIHQSTTSNLVRALVQQGLVQADKAASDKRMVELYALPDGFKILRKVPQPFAGLLPQVLSELDAQTLEQLELHLGALIERLQVDGQSARTPLAMM